MIDNWLDDKDTREESETEMKERSLGVRWSRVQANEDWHNAKEVSQTKWESAAR